MVLWIGTALVISGAAYAKGSPVVFHTEADNAEFVAVPHQPQPVIRHPRKPHHYRATRPR
jgi:hypothetical protein